MKVINNFLSSVNLTQDDLDIKFMYNDHHYKIKSFSIPWIIIYGVTIVAVLKMIQLLLTVSILILN